MVATSAGLGRSEGGNGSAATTDEHRSQQHNRYQTAKTVHDLFHVTFPSDNRPNGLVSEFLNNYLSNTLADTTYLCSSSFFKLMTYLPFFQAAFFPSIFTCWM